MKTKKLLSILLLLSVCVAAALNVYNQSQTPQYSDLTIANIEAMAGDGNTGEGSGGTRGPAIEKTCGYTSSLPFTEACTTNVLFCKATEDLPCEQVVCSVHQKS